MNATALIADDEANLREHLRAKLALCWPELRIVAEASNGVEAARLIASTNPFVAFLDIRMPGLSGLDVAQGIEGDTRVVFVTAYDQFAVDAFERDAVDYLVKPVNDARLAQAVERLKRSLRESSPAPELARLLATLTRQQQPGGSETGAPLRWIRASRGDTTFHIPVEDVTYFQSDDKYTTVNTVAGEHLIRTPLAELAISLDGSLFWQIHRSSIVNMRFVASTRRDETGRLFVQMRDGKTELRVSRAYVHLFRQM